MEEVEVAYDIYGHVFGEVEKGAHSRFSYSG